MLWSIGDAQAADKANHSADQDNDGVTGIKYGLLGTLIAVTAVIMMGTVGTDLVSTFGSFDSNLVVPSPAHARDGD